MATKSFIKTIGQKGLLADYNTEGKKLQTQMTAGDNINISADNVISAANVLEPKDISNDPNKDFNNLPEDNVLYYKNSSIDFANQPKKGAYRFIQWTSSLYYSVQIAIDGNNQFFARSSYRRTPGDRFKTWSPWIKLQENLTFDTTPTAGSNNPVTSDGIRTMQPISHRFDNETSSRLIIWGKPNNDGYFRDIVRKFGLQYGSMTDFLFTNSVHKDDTTSVSIKILNDSGIPTTSTKRLKASIFKDSSENSYFALWLDGSISQPGWAYYADYYPDVSEKDSIVRHFTVFNPSEYTHVRDLTIKYIPFAVPNPSAGVLTSNGTSNSWLTPPASGTAVLKSVNGVLQWVIE